MAWPESMTGAVCRAGPAGAQPARGVGVGGSACRCALLGRGPESTSSGALAACGTSCWRDAVLETVGFTKLSEVHGWNEFGGSRVPRPGLVLQGTRWKGLCVFLAVRVDQMSLWQTGSAHGLGPSHSVRRGSAHGLSWLAWVSSDCTLDGA